MFPENYVDENVVHLKTQADLLRERSRKETAAIEREIYELGEKHRALIRHASLRALSNRSQFFADYARFVVQAEDALKDAETLLENAKPLFAQQLTAYDVAKTAHESYTQSIRDALSTDPEHQALRNREREVGQKIIEAEKLARAATRRTGVLGQGGQILRNALAIFGWHPAKNQSVSVSDQVHRSLHEELRLIQRKSMSLREAALNSIHSSSAAFDIIKRGFQGVQARKDELTFDVAVKRQTLNSLKDLSHPVAQRAVSDFEELVMSARIGEPSYDALVFALGSKVAADQLLAEMKALDEQELRLQAELHYAQEDEKRADTRFSFGERATLSHR